MWNYIIPIVTFVVGGAAGFFAGVYYLRKQIERIQNDPAMMQQMAKRMGYNLNKQQMHKVQQMLKKQKWK